MYNVAHSIPLALALPSVLHLHHVTLLSAMSFPIPCSRANLQQVQYSLHHSCHIV